MATGETEGQSSERDVHADARKATRRNRREAGKAEERTRAFVSQKKDRPERATLSVEAILARIAEQKRQMQKLQDDLSQLEILIADALAQPQHDVGKPKRRR